MTTRHLNERRHIWGMDRSDPTGLAVVLAAWLVALAMLLVMILV